MDTMIELPAMRRSAELAPNTADADSRTVTASETTSRGTGHMEDTMADHYNEWLRNSSG